MSWDLVAGRILPGHPARAGIRLPPSRTVPLVPRNGVYPHRDKRPARRRCRSYRKPACSWRYQSRSVHDAADARLDHGIAYLLFAADFPIIGMREVRLVVLGEADLHEEEARCPWQRLQPGERFLLGPLVDEGDGVAVEFLRIPREPMPRRPSAPFMPWPTSRGARARSRGSTSGRRRCTRSGDRG